MKKRATSINKNRLHNNSRRRLLLKKVHIKVLSRRQQFQIDAVCEAQVTSY